MLFPYCSGIVSYRQNHSSYNKITGSSSNQTSFEFILCCLLNNSLDKAVLIQNDYSHPHNISFLSVSKIYCMYPRWRATARNLATFVVVHLLLKLYLSLLSAYLGSVFICLVYIIQAYRLHTAIFKENNDDDAVSLQSTLPFSKTDTLLPGWFAFHYTFTQYTFYFCAFLVKNQCISLLALRVSFFFFVIEKLLLENEIESIV